MKIIPQTPSIAPPPSPYSLVTRGGGFLFISGQVSMEPTTHGFVLGGIEAQTKLSLDNLRLILADCGATLDDVVKTTVYLTDYQRDFQGMNRVFQEVFPTAPPARATLGVAALADGLLVEIEATALAPDSD
jgi:2-iminobutanoate/2-iminopropanoate deaminase